MIICPNCGFQHNDDTLDDFCSRACRREYYFEDDYSGESDDYLSQYDNDPNPYDGTYSEE